MMNIRTQLVRFVIGCSFAMPLLAWSCQVEVQMAPGSPPAVGGTGIITVTFTQTHNNCKLKPEQTKVKTTGCAILGATPWKETKAQVFTRKFKIRFQEAGEALFEVKRSCPRGGCLKEFRFKIAP